MPDRIGDKPVTKLPNGDIKIGENVTVTGSDEFKNGAIKDLKEIGDTRVGKSIFEAMDNSHHQATIAEATKVSAQNNGGICTADNPADGRDPTKGTNSTVTYHPTWSTDQYTDQHGNLVDHPAKAYLAHEMIHAVHNANGQNINNQLDPREAGSNQEESQTIGINDHAAGVMTENNLLKELGYHYTRTNHDMTAHSDP